MGSIAVIAHRKKSLGGGLAELRRLLADAGYTAPLWYEVAKSRKAGKKARKSLKKGADLVLVWGGDGTVQRCIDALAGSSVPVAIVPAGTANLLAASLGIPTDLRAAVRVALSGGRRRLDLGRLDGEHFAVMAGAGFDGDLIRDAGRRLKRRFGRLAYVWSGLRHVRDGAVPATVCVDGVTWFEGPASCVLVGNVGTIGGGIRAFDDARPDDGWLDVGVATAQGALQWALTLGRITAGRSEESPFVHVTRAKKVTVTLGAPMTYELDGGARGAVRGFEARVVPQAVTVCVPDGVQ